MPVHIRELIVKTHIAQKTKEAMKHISPNISQQTEPMHSKKLQSRIQAEIHRYMAQLQQHKNNAHGQT